MIPLHCLWAKSNNRTHGQFECDVTWFCFCFISFDRMYGAVIVPQFVGEGGGNRLKLDVQGQEGGKILDVDGQGGWGVLIIRQFSWTSYVYRP